MWGKRLTADAVYFRNSYHDLVDFSAQQFRLINRSAVETSGMEFETKALIADGFQFGASVNYIDWSLNPSTEPFRNIPHWRVASSLAWSPSRKWKLGLEFLGVGRRADFQLPVPSVGTVGGYSTLSLQAMYEASPRASVFFRVDNLLNAKYHQFVGFPDPGVYARAGVTFHALR